MYISVLLPIQIGKTMKGQNQKKKLAVEWESYIVGPQVIAIMSDFSFIYECLPLKLTSYTRQWILK